MTFAAFAVFRAVFKRTWLKTLRRPVLLTFSLVQPLLWMLFFGFLFERYTLDEMPVDLQYLDFLVPGVCCMTVLFGASQAGIELIRDMQSRFLARTLATPASKTMIMAGKVLADSSRLLVQALLVLLLGLALGAQVHLSLASLALMMTSLLLFGFAFCSLSCWIALKARSQENMASFVHLVNMPMLFTSTALVPSKQMPAWLANLARFNPLSLVVDNNRAVLLPGANAEWQVQLLPLAIMAVLLFLAAVYALKNYKA
jgi:ABC-2 type transport system permease protein